MGRTLCHGTWGAEIIDELKPLPDDIVIRKRRYDAFFGTDLDYVLRHVVHATNLVIVGTVANICLLHTAGSAALNWYNVVVPIDASPHLMNSIITLHLGK